MNDDTPARHLHRTRGFLRKFLAIYSEVDVSQRAASFAYYAFFSIFPFLALCLSLGSYFFSTEKIVSFFDQAAPLSKSQQEFVWSLVDSLEQARGGISIASFCILLWSSSRFFQALVHGVNRAWHTFNLPWWQTSLKNLAMLAITASALAAGIFIPTLLQAARAVAVSHFPTAAVTLVLSATGFVRVILASALLFYAISLLYMLAPRKKMRFSRIWPSALLATVLLQALQFLFVNYIPHLVNYNAIYGTVGSLMFLLMWVYISGIIIISGACLGAAWEEYSAKSEET